MDLKELNYYYNKFKFGEDTFHSLMSKRVREILLVSTFYDAFIFEQDGRLSEQIHGEYQQLNLSTAPRITSVPTGQDALNILKEKKFDLVITMIRIGDVNPFQLSKRIKENYPGLPVLLLLNVDSDVSLLKRRNLRYIDDVFLWKGDSKIFLAMIKAVEDKRNVEYDTKHGLVRVVLLIEDSIHFYSRFLPLLYAEMMEQTQRLISEELNDINKRLRMRARPKVLLVHTYDEAVEILEKYGEYIIGIISDVKYLRKGRIDSRAGIKLIDKVREQNLDIPMLVQSSDSNNKELADRHGIHFLHKHSDSLLKDLRQFVLNNLGFGDFVFCDKQGNEICRARSMSEFEERLKTVPDESLLYHAARNDFSAWLIAHGVFLIAKRIRALKAEDFTGTDELRNCLISTFEEVRYLRNRGKIVNFDVASINVEEGIVRLCEGSFGGKGRSLAFLDALLVSMEFDQRFPNVSIKIPKTFIIGTREFDYFLEHNEISDDIINLSDKEIRARFLQGELSPELSVRLLELIENVNYPLAVRSSGLLEDSQSQPIAGIYQTYMLPNNHPDVLRRYSQLMDAIKLVFSSVFWKNAKQYIEGIQLKLEEEKLAVIVEEVAGSQHDGYFYPHLSGVAQSYNYYPTSYLTHSDGITNVALGMGKAVVDGMKTFFFCPSYPRMDILQPETLLRNSQTEFYAIDLSKKDFDLAEGEAVTYAKLDLKIAENHGTLTHLASVWDYRDDRLVESLSTPGARVVMFADILKYDCFPLAGILKELLEIGSKAVGVPVEIEFAVDLTKDEAKQTRPTFHILQMRPLTVNLQEIHVDISKVQKEDMFLYTEKGMGNGVVRGIRDVVYVDSRKFDSTKTIEMANEVERVNEVLRKENRDYILIGPGRWGSRDRFLGVPVRWNQINRAKIIVETGLNDVVIDSSQGTHFFHNLVAMNVGYFTVSRNSEKGFIDWNWLHEQPVRSRMEHFTHVELSRPLLVKIDGRSGIAVICKKGEIES